MDNHNQQLYRSQPNIPILIRSGNQKVDNKLVTLVQNWPVELKKCATTVSGSSG